MDLYGYGLTYGHLTFKYYILNYTYNSKENLLAGFRVQRNSQGIIVVPENNKIRLYIYPLQQFLRPLHYD
jgi:hypothetical protein